MNDVLPLLPTTMVGSYPRPKWFNYQLLGRDVRVAFKHVDHAEAFADATAASIHDQEEAGLPDLDATARLPEVPEVLEEPPKAAFLFSPELAR